MENLNLEKSALSKFGMTMSVAFLIISGLFLFRGKHAVAVFALIFACLFFASRLFLPKSLKPVYIIWMHFAFILAWINTRIILIIMFYVILTPIGLFMRLFRKDLLERKRRLQTYWKNKDSTFNPLNYERRF